VAYSTIVFRARGGAGAFDCIQHRELRLVPGLSRRALGLI